MPVIYTDRERSLTLKELIFPVLILFSLFVLFLRLWYLQVVQAPYLAERAHAFDEVVIKKEAPRGLITDRKGQLLAGVRAELVITAEPAIVQKHPEALVTVAKLLNVPIKKIEKKLKDAYRRPYSPTPIYIGASVEVASKIAEAANDLPGFGVESQAMRYYTDPTLMPHVMGYVWTPNERDIRRLKTLGQEVGTYVGKSGIEQYYELDLVGIPGMEKIEIDVHRRPLKTISIDHSVPGKKLVLTVDQKLQKLAVEKLQGRPGSIIAIEPLTGEILCMASSPGYDASMFSRGVSSSEWKQIIEDPKHPFINRAIAARYPPGSIFKIVTAFAAMREGKFSPYDTVHCKGATRIGNRSLKCLGVHGTVNFESAFAKSCNYYIAKLALDAGPDVLRDIAVELGLNKRTGIDILGEVAGIIPTDEWIRKWRKPPVWRTGDTINLSIGQGEVCLTPLQMASLVSLVANKGISYRPHLIKAKISSNDKKDSKNIAPEVLARFNLSDSQWNLLYRAMFKTVEAGTARRSQSSTIKWAAKTGSADHRKDLRAHSWCVSFAPIDNPQIALAVIVEASGVGGKIAAPISKDLIEAYCCNKN